MCPPACFHERRIGEKKIDQGAVKAICIRIMKTKKEVDFSFEETEENRNLLLSSTGFVHSDWLCTLSLWSLLHMIHSCMYSPEVYLYELCELNLLVDMQRLALLRVCKVFPRKRPTVPSHLQIIDVDAMSCLLRRGGPPPTLADIPFLSVLHPSSSSFENIAENDISRLPKGMRTRVRDGMKGTTTKCRCEFGCTARKCPNRSVEMVLCTTDNCEMTSDGRPCGNRYEDLDSSSVEGGWSGNDALGNALWCTKPVFPGTILTEMTGELLIAPPLGEENFYLMGITTPQGTSLPTLFLDSTRKGNKGRFANHSCIPNAEYTVFIKDSGLPVVFIVAKYDIPVGCMVTVEYGSKYHKFECACGHICCSSQVFFKECDLTSNIERNHNRRSTNISKNNLKKKNLSQRHLHPNISPQ